MIEQLINKIQEERRRIALDHKDFEDWSIEIYVNYDWLCEVFGQMHGEQSELAMEMYQQGTIQGFPIYKVVGDNHPHNAVFSRPPVGHTR